jgi:lipoyl synthase
MLNNPLVNPSTALFPIFSANPPSRNRLSFVHIPQSSSLESSSSSKVESSESSSNTYSSSSPAKLLGTFHAVSTPPYPGGMGPHTGRDPNLKKPDWLRQRAPQGEKFGRLKDSIGELKLNTVCVEAQCPNIGEVLLFQITPF